MREKNFDPEIRALLKEETIKYCTALFLNKLTKGERPLLFRLFREIKLGINKQREIIEWLEDVMKRDGKKADVVLDKTGLDAILDDIALNAPQKGDLFRERLFDLRFPEISKYQAALKDKLNTLSLPHGVKLIPITPLEDGEFRLEIAFHSAEGLQEKLVDVEKLSRGETMMGLWDHTHSSGQPLV